MLRATFLGHQGWLFRTDNATVLVDPLLIEPFGHEGRVGYLYPPRQIEVKTFPPVSAVVLTHEHEDHFNLPSLALLDRQIPIYISSRSSIALSSILNEMGFAIHLLEPGLRVRIGDLWLLPMTPDQSSDHNGDELDVLTFLIKPLDGDGSFFSEVDVLVTSTMLKTLARHVPELGVWCHSNNSMSFGFMSAGQSTGVERGPFQEVEQLSRFLLHEHDRLPSGMSGPRLAVVCGAGFSFAGDREYMNHNVFTVSCEEAAQSLSRNRPDRRFLAPEPGQTLAITRHEVTIEAPESFLLTRPRIEWPSREFRGDVKLLDTYEPACARYSVTMKERREIERGLADFAAHLYLGPNFRSLYSLSRAGLGARRPTFVLVLLTDKEPLMYEYSPQSCGFIQASDDNDAVRDYLAGVECWATDLLSLFRGEFGPSAITLGRCRIWNAVPRRHSFDFFIPLWNYAHPLRRPSVFLSMYRRIGRQAQTAKPSIRFRG